MMNKAINNRLRVAIMGANGYGGAELLRILSNHPQVTLSAVISRSEAGTLVADYFPQFYGKLSDAEGHPLSFVSIEAVDWDAIDVCFFATPHAVAMHQAEALLDSGVTVIDLSADFRLKAVSQWEQWYDTEHVAPALIPKAVYGLPEMNRDALQSANLIACPGCYPTAIQLGLMPLLEQNLIEPDSIIIDAKSGVSGAGRAAKTAMLMSERAENFSAYAVSGHRHLPEIEQQLSIMANQSVSVIFTPHLVPMHRGIFATIYAKCTEPSADLQTVFEKAYCHEPFVKVLASGKYPETRAVRGTNDVHIAVARPPNKANKDYVTVLVVEDNLVKGAAGQAVQCMNICFDFPETLGLDALMSV